MSSIFVLMRNGVTWKDLENAVSELGNTPEQFPYMLLSNPDEPLYMVSRWLTHASDGVPHRTRDLLMMESGGVEAKLSGDKLQEFLVALDEDIKEAISKKQDYAMFSMLRQLILTASRYGLAIRWG